MILLKNALTLNIEYRNKMLDSNTKISLWPFNSVFDEYNLNLKIDPSFYLPSRDIMANDFALSMAKNFIISQNLK